MAVRRGAGKRGVHRVVLRRQRGFEGEGVLPLGKGGGEVGHGLDACYPAAELQGAEAGFDAGKARLLQAGFYGGGAVGLHDPLQRFAFLRDRHL